MRIDLKQYTDRELWSFLSDLTKVIPESDNKLWYLIGGGVIREIDNRLQTEYDK